MISGTVAVTTTPQALAASLGGVSHLILQVIGAGTVIVGSRVGVTAGNGIQVGSTNGPVSLGQSGTGINLTDVFVAAVTGTAVLMYTGI